MKIQLFYFNEIRFFVKGLWVSRQGYLVFLFYEDFEPPGPVGAVS